MCRWHLSFPFHPSQGRIHLECGCKYRLLANKPTYGILFSKHGYMVISIRSTEITGHGNKGPLLKLNADVNAIVDTV